MQTAPHAPSYMPQLDSLRGLAAVAVLVSHAVPHSNFATQHLHLGHSAVRLFFVLSGFLITGILLRARDDSTSLTHTLKAFYARRALRIFPLYYFVLLAMLVLGSTVVWESAGYHFLYLSNVLTAINGEHSPAPVAHLWSLAVEEQFYLLWPSVILFLPTRYLKSAIIVAVVIGPVSRLLIGTLGFPAVTASVVPTSCLDTLGMGAWLAYAWHKGIDATRLCRYGVVVGFTVLAASLFSQHAGYRLTHEALFDLGLAFSFTWLVNGAACGFSGVAKRGLEWRPLVWLGAISYGLYVYHGLIPAAVPLLEGHLDVWLRLPSPGAARVLYYFAATIPVAALSWYLFERPINNLKQCFPYQPPVTAKEQPEELSEWVATS